MSNMAINSLMDAQLNSATGVQETIDLAKGKFDRGEKVDIKLSGTKKSLHIYTQVIGSKASQNSVLYVVENSPTERKISFAERNKPLVALEANPDRPKGPNSKSNGNLSTPLLA